MLVHLWATHRPVFRYAMSRIISILYPCVHANCGIHSENANSCNDMMLMQHSAKTKNKKQKEKKWKGEKYFSLRMIWSAYLYIVCNWIRTTCTTCMRAITHNNIVSWKCFFLYLFLSIENSIYPESNLIFANIIIIIHQLCFYLYGTQIWALLCHYTVSWFMGHTNAR